MSEREPLEYLSKHLEFVAEDRPSGSLWFVTTDSFQQQRELTECLAAKWDANCQITSVSFKEDPFSFWDTVRALDPNTAQLILVRDFDQLAPEAFEQGLSYLNRGREAINRGRYHLVFFLLEPSIPDLMMRAGDFWAWRSGVTHVVQETELPDEAPLWQNLVKRYAAWLKEHAFDWERTRLRHLQNAVDHADFAWFERYGVVLNQAGQEQARKLEELVGLAERQVVIAPFGYYKAKEMIERFLEELETLMAAAPDEEMVVPIAIDIEALDWREPVLSETNLQTIFGPYLPLFRLKQLPFRIYCSAFEQLSDTLQQQALEAFEQLKPKQVIVTCNDGAINQQAFEVAGYTQIEVLPIAYRWLEHNVRQIWGVDLKYRRRVYELIRIPEVRAAMVFLGYRSSLKLRYYILFWNLRMTHLITSLKPILLIRNKSTQKYERQGDMAESVSYQSASLNKFLLFNKVKKGEAVFSKVKGALAEIKFHGAQREVGFFYSFQRLRRGIFPSLDLNDWKVAGYISAINLSFLDSDQWSEEIDGDNYKVTIADLPPILFCLNEMFVYYDIFLSALFNKYDELTPGTLERAVAKFRTWFLGNSRDPIPESDRDDWIDLLREAYEEPIFQEHFLPMMQTAAKQHADPVTQAIAQAVLQPPPLPEQAIREQSLYTET